MSRLRDWLSELIFAWERIRRPMYFTTSSRVACRNVKYRDVHIRIEKRVFTRHYAFGFKKHFVTFTMSMIDPPELSDAVREICHKSLTLPAMLPAWVNHDVQYEIALQAYIDYLHGYLIEK